MSFFERAGRHPSSRHLAQAVRLAADGHVHEAVKVWKYHKEQADLCICGVNTFDGARCGGCFTGKLLALELEHGPFVRDVDFLGTARRVQGVIGTPGAVNPIAPATGSRTL